MAGYARTTVLLAALTALFVGIGWVAGGRQGMFIAFLVACGTNLWAWWNSDRVVLSMHNAQPLDPAAAPRLHALVADLAARAGLPTPAIYVIEEDQPNAFATGRSPDRAAVALNTGLLDLMDERAVAGIVAHELAHIRNRDTLIMTVTATLAGAIGMLAQFGFLFGGRNQEGRQNPFGPIGAILLLIVGPIAATLVQLAISRSREYEADRLGAEITGDPRALAAALSQLEDYGRDRVNHTAEAHPASAHLFIVNPLSGLKLDGLFRTHPATADRVARLLAQAQAQSTMLPTGPDPWRRGLTQPPRRNPWG